MEPHMSHPATTPTNSPNSLIGKIFTGCVLLAGIGSFFLFDLGHYLSLDALKANRDNLLQYTTAHYEIAVAVFVFVYILQTAFSLPGGAVLTLTGGFLFGSLMGTLIVNVGATAGATLAFLASRYLLHDWVEQKFGDRLGPIQAGFAQNAFSYLMTLRLIPAFPFFLVNLVSGLTRVSLSTYVLATSIGIIPGSFCLCVCRPPIRNHQFFERNCQPAGLTRLYAPGLVSPHAGGLPEMDEYEKRIYPFLNLRDSKIHQTRGLT